MTLEAWSADHDADGAIEGNLAHAPDGGCQCIEVLIGTDREPHDTEPLVRDETGQFIRAGRRTGADVPPAGPQEFLDDRIAEAVAIAGCGGDQGLEPVIIGWNGIKPRKVVHHALQLRDTHGHIDDLCRFVHPKTVVLCRESNPNDANYNLLEENRERLEGFRLNTKSKINI